MQGYAGVQAASILGRAVPVVSIQQLMFFFFNTMVVSILFTATAPPSSLQYPIKCHIPLNATESN